MEEWVDVKKVQLYFSWFKDHNPLFHDIELSEELISMFQKDTMDAATEFEQLKNEEEADSMEDIHDHESETEYDECEECSLSDLENKVEPMDEIESMNQTSMFANKYEEDADLPTVANKLADIINELEKSKKLGKHYDDDFVHEYTDIPCEQDTDPNQITPEDDSVPDIECKTTSFHPYPTDEIEIIDETDLLNTAVILEDEEILISDDEEELVLQVESKERILHLDLNLIQTIHPDTCLKDAEQLLRQLSDCLEEFDEEKGKQYLDLLNELGFKILEKLDKFCPPSSERKKLSKSINEFCDKIDEIGGKIR